MHLHGNDVEKKKEEEEDGPSALTSATHVGNPNEAPGPWLWPGQISL